MGATRGADFLQRKKYGRLPIYIVRGITLTPTGCDNSCRTPCHRGERARRRRIIRPQGEIRASSTRPNWRE